MGNIFAGLRRLSPLGPIFGKELRTTARRKRTYVLRSLYLAGLLVMLLFVYMSSGSYYYRYGESVARRAQRNAEMGAFFFGTFAFFNLFAMACIGPILTCTAINSERLRKTLNVLLMTPISAWQIVSGKLFSRLWIALTLIGLTLPALSVIRLLGGVEIGQMLASVALCVCTVIMAASFGLLLSALMNRACAVIFLSYAFLLGLWALLPLFMLLSANSLIGGAGPDLWFYTLLNLTNAPFVMVGIVAPNGPASLSIDWRWCALSELGMAFGMLLPTTLILRRMARRESVGTQATLPPVLPPPSASGDGAILPAAAIAPPPLPISSPRLTREVSDNPVLWREVRRPMMAKVWQRLVAAFAVLGLLGLIYLLLADPAGGRNELADPDTHIGFGFIFCGILTLLSCIMSATVIAQEKESDTWTLLLSTPLSAGQIVFGKLLGLHRRLFWPSMLIAGHFVLFALLDVISWGGVAVTLWMIFTTNFIWLAMGIYLSLRLRSVTFAVILNLLGPVLLYGGMAIGLTIAGMVLARSDDWAEIVGLYAPHAYIDLALEKTDGDVWMPVFGPVPWSSFYVFAFVNGAAHLLASWGVIGLTIAGFDRIVGRSSQALPLPPVPVISAAQGV